MVESNTMSEDVIERGIVKQSPSPSSVDETLGKYGDVVSDASSSRFGSQCQHNTFAFRSGKIAQKWKDKEYSLKYWGLDTLFTELNDTSITRSQNVVGKPQKSIIS